MPTKTFRYRPADRVRARRTRRLRNRRREGYQKAPLEWFFRHHCRDGFRRIVGDKLDRSSDGLRAIERLVADAESGEQTEPEHQRRNRHKRRRDHQAYIRKHSTPLNVRVGSATKARITFGDRSSRGHVGLASATTLGRRIAGSQTGSKPAESRRFTLDEWAGKPTLKIRFGDLSMWAVWNRRGWSVSHKLRVTRCARHLSRVTHVPRLA